MKEEKAQLLDSSSQGFYQAQNSPAQEGAPTSPFPGQPQYNGAPTSPYSGQPQYGGAPMGPYPGMPQYGGAPTSPYSGQPQYGGVPMGPYPGMPQYGAPMAPYQSPSSPSSGVMIGGTGVSFKGDEVSMAAFGSSVSVNSDLIAPKDHGDHPFLYRAELSCCTGCLVKCTPIFPCMEPWIVVSALLETTSQMKVGPFRFRFDGTAGDYCCHVCICNKCLTFWTGCMWELCGCADRRRNEWIDHHIHMYVDQNQNQCRQ